MLPISALQLSQLDAAAETAAAAFYSYPMFTAYFPNPEQRRWKTRWYVRNAIKIALEYGDVQATQDLQGIAFALPPEHTHLPVSVFIRSGYWKAPLVLGLRDFYRSQACEEAVGEAHTRWMQTQPHYYLWGLTVHPQAQGRGYGKALLNQLLKKAAAQHIPVYLETHTENNVSYYQALGFECLERVITPSYELPFWCLVWRPQDGGASQ